MENQNLYKKMLIADTVAPNKKNQDLYKKYKANREEYYKNNRSKIISASSKWYYKNREYVLERNKQKKYATNAYYKEWYAKNKAEVNARRAAKRGKTTLNNSNSKYIPPTLPKKPVSFIINFN